VPSFYDNLEDAALVRAMELGQKEAGRVLVDRYLSSVYATALRICGNSADAEDLTQDTFIRAFERLGQYHSEFSFRNWLLKIVTNLTISHLRSIGRERENHHRLSLSGRNGSNGTQERWDDEECRHWLGKIDVNQRTAIVLFHFEGKTYVEVAQMMAVPVNTVRSLIHRGRKRLKELMTGDNVQAERTHEMS